MKQLKRYTGPAIVAIIFLIIIFGGALVTIYTDWLWFKDLGFGSVFTTRILTKLGIGCLFGILFFAIVYGNLWHARRIAPPASTINLEQQLMERLGRFVRQWLGLLIFLGSIILAGMVGLEAATHWQEWLMYFHSTPFGKADGVFGKDISFYVFKLPLLTYLYNWLFFTLVVTTIATVAFHYADEGIEYYGNRFQFAPGVKAHIFILIALMFFLKAIGYRLAMYNTLFSRATLFDGAGYTEIHANLPALWIMIFIAAVAGLLAIYNISRRGVSYALAGFIGLIGASILIGSAYPAAVQQFSVVPNEQSYQSPYISRAIGATKEAYGLTEVTSKKFAAESNLNAGQITDNKATIDNVRLWGADQLQAQYNQLQTIQQYYHFQDMDVDRYWITDPKMGRKSYRQVWLSARELSQDRLPEKSRTWINRYLKYTHGYGFCMSPVNEVSEEGGPQFFVNDIPPQTTVDIPLKKMGIYFGELTSDHVFVKTSAGEYDYPTGSGNISTAFTGSGGVRVGGFWRKLLFALRFSDINLLLNDNIKQDSRVLYRREIRDRTQTLLPFLKFDSDPYLVTADGDLYWILDAYTVTDAYPYSKYSQTESFEFNYIRNSVKVVVNAYTGKVDAYIIEQPLNDPIIRTYAKIYPGIFKPISRMPAKLREHIRYPEDLFRIQTSVYTRYHYSKNRPEDFYGNSDLWEMPRRANLVGENTEASEAMDPYYIIMKLPHGASEEFVLMNPYVHSGERKNMVAWMCARCDTPNYGKLVLYKFTTKTVKGPQQIASLASQDPVISPQISLWNKEGSAVGTGNFLVIPVESSFLYVVPVYMSSRTTGVEIPEIIRIIASMGDKVAMAPTLNGALSALLGESIEESQPSAPTVKAGLSAQKGGVVVITNAEIARLVRQANSQYEKAVQAQKSGDWAAYGQQINALKQTLQELKAKAK